MILRRVLKNEVITPETDYKEWLDFLGIEDENDLTGLNSLKETTVFTCIKIRSETLSNCPLKIYQDKDGIKKATEHYLYRLLKLRPNPFMSAKTFWGCMEVQRMIYGNAYAWLDMDMAGKIKGIYPLDASHMQIYVDNAGIFNSENNIWYIYSVNGKRYKLLPDEVYHFKGFTTNGIVGISPLEALKTTVENAKSSAEFLNNSYKSGMQTSGIINYTGTLDDKQKEIFLEKFAKMSAGLKNANRTALMPIGFQYQPIALKLTDAQFIENTRFTLQQLTAAFGIKPHQINDQSKTSYASAAEAYREFYTGTMLDAFTVYEQEITYKSFLDSEIDDGLYVKFNVDVILRADIKTRYAAYATAIQNGFKTDNEIRALEEDVPLEGGDDLLCNGNMIKVKDIGKEK